MIVERITSHISEVGGIDLQRALPTARRRAIDA